MHAIFLKCMRLPARVCARIAPRPGVHHTPHPPPSFLPVLQVLACSAHAQSVERDRRRRRQKQRQAQSGEGASQTVLSDGELSDSADELCFVENFKLARKPSSMGLYKFLTRRMRQLTEEPDAEWRYCILCAQETK